MTTGIRSDGDFCWLNILTPDPYNARAFFAKVLRWTYVEMPGSGHRIQVRGRDIGALFDVISARTPGGAQPTVGVMIKVRSADAIAARVKALGGLAMPPFDVGNAGRMAVCFDPNGAEFDVWEPGSMKGFDVDSSLFGAPSWFESMTAEVERDRSFYSALFGWTTSDVRLPGRTYTMFGNGGTAPIAGMVRANAGARDLKPRWGVYFTVDNADDTAKLAALMGGTIYIQPETIPGVGRFCYIRSPEGVFFYAITYQVA